MQNYISGRFGGLTIEELYRMIYGESEFDCMFDKAEITAEATAESDAAIFKKCVKFGMTSFADQVHVLSDHGEGIMELLKEPVVQCLPETESKDVSDFIDLCGMISDFFVEKVPLTKNENVEPSTEEDAIYFNAFAKYVFFYAVIIYNWCLRHNMHYADFMKYLLSEDTEMDDLNLADN